MRKSAGDGMNDDGLKDGLSADEFAGVRGELRDAVPPIDQLGCGAELRRDLWPDMLRRLERPPVRVPWFDWALLAISGAAAIFFPALIPALLYHL
jgi:hypothetical protein